MTEGSIVKNIIIFTIPLLLGQFLQNLYNSVDSMVVGKIVGVTALAAVTASENISNLLVGFFTGLSTRASVLFAQYFGGKQNDKLHDSIHTALTFSIIIGVTLAVLGIIFTPQLLGVVGCPDEVFPEAQMDLRIYLIGVLFTSIYNVAAGVLRAVGDSGTPFIFLAISCVTNIGLDIAFVAWFGLGVMGVALATIISQLLSVVLVTLKMLRTKDVYRLHVKDLKINGPMLKEVIRLGLPAGIQTAIISISNLFVQRYQNSFGQYAMAGIGAANKLDKYAGMVGQTLGLGTATFVGQNIGAKKYQRAFKGIRIVLLMGLIFVIMVGTPMYIFPDFFLRLFTDSEEAIYYGRTLMKIMLPFFYCQTIQHVIGNSIRGFGKSVITMINSVLGMVVCRQIFLAITMNIDYNIKYVNAGYPVGWIAAAVFGLTYYFLAIRIPYNKKRKLGLIDEA